EHRLAARPRDHEGGRCRRNAGRHPSPGLLQEALHALCVGERHARLAQALRERRAVPLSGRLLGRTRQGAVVDALDRAPQTLPNKLFIGNEFVDALDGATIDVLAPHDNSLITKIAAAAERDVDRAVAAAEAAFPAWSTMAAADR